MGAIMSRKKNANFASLDAMLAEYVRSCRETFDSLMASHEITSVKSQRRAYEFVVEYEDQARRVSVLFDFLALLGWFSKRRKVADGNGEAFINSTRRPFRMTNRLTRCSVNL